MSKLAAAICGVLGGAVATAVQAGPGDAQVVAGTGSIVRNGSETLVEQSSDRLAIDWQTFDLAADEAVRFAQPGAQSVALNRIFDQNPSSILGAIEANGRVYLVNPNGIVFGESARIDVGALLATSLDVPLDALGGERLELAAGAAAPGAIVNRGLLRAAAGGTIALVGGSVVNEGVIVADLGNVALGAGRRVTLDFDGDGLLYFEVDEELLENPSNAAAAVVNNGELRADGGQVLMTARAAQGVFSSVVNNAGAIRAARIDDSGGVVRLVGTGGTVVTSGTIAARGATAADTGGDVALLGDRVGALGSAAIDVSGAAGGGTISLGGGLRGSGDGPRSLYTIVADDVRLSADALDAGDGGTIAVWADAATWFRGTASARGGTDGGDGGFVEISGREWLSFDGRVDTRAPQGRLGTLLFDPRDITIVDGDIGADDGELPDLSGATPPNGDFEISEQALESLAADANIVLEASRNIVMEDLGDDLLDLATTEAGSLTITADADGSGDGAFTMDASDTIRVEGAHVAISGAAVTVGGIDTTGADGSRATGVITLTSMGDVTVDGALVSNEAIQVFVDANANDVATLRLRGSAAAPDVQLAGGSDADDVLEAGPGDDAFAVTGAGSGTLNGMAFTSFGALDGAGGSDTLTARADADDFNVSGTGAGSLNGLAFERFEVLAGAGGADTFELDADFGGALQGGAGDDVFVVNASQTGTIDGGADADTVTLASGVGVAGLSGGAGGDDDDTLVAAGAGANTWTVTALDAGTLNGSGFSEFENLSGGSGTDTFTFDAGLTGRADGNAGADSFTVASGVTVGRIDGGTGTDTLALSGGAATFTLSAQNTGTLNGNAFFDVENLTGTAAADTFNLAFGIGGTASGLGGDDVFNLGANASAAIAGGDGNDTITAAASQPTTFTVTGTGSGTITNGAGNVGFATVENLIGGNAADTFELDADFAGTLQGGAGADVFNVDASQSGSIDGGADADTVTLAAGVTVASLAGGAGGNDDDTLAAVAGTNTWTVTAPDAGTLNGSSFGEFENLSGGTGSDAFTLNASLTGGADGNAGNDSFSVANGVTVGRIDGGDGADTVALASGAAIGLLTGGTGGDDDDTLAATGAGANTWVVTAPDAGTLNATSFTEFENLSGGVGNDSFTFGAALTGSADGNAGDDSFSVASGVTVGRIDGGTGTDTLALSSGAATFTLTAVNTGTLNGNAFFDVENLTGTAAADTFNLAFGIGGTASGLGGDDVFRLGANASAAIAGGDGNDTITADASQSTTFTVTSTNAGTIANGTGNVGFTAVENLTGGNAADTFQLNANLTGTAAGGAGNDVFVASASIAGTIDGGADADTVTLAPGVTIGSLAGGSTGNDNDTLAVSGAAANSWLVSAQDSGLLNAQLFADFENLAGGDGADTFTFVGSLSGTAAGGSGNDVFAVLSGSAAAFDGGAGSDFLSYAGSVTPVTLSAAALLGAGIETVAGSASGNDVLRGSGANDAFVTSSVDGGTLNGLLAYSSFEFLEGLGGNDTFTLNHNVSGGVSGGAGDDVFDVAAGVVAALDGGTDLDTLTLTSGTATYTLTAENAGTLNGSSFVSIENLRGTANADVFDLAFNLTGVASGLGGNDRFIVHAGASAEVAGGDGLDTLEGDAVQSTAFDVTAANAGTAASGAGTVTFASVEHLAGGAAADTFDLGAGLDGGASGGGGDDVFDVAAGVTATLDGGAGSDTLRGASTAAEYTIAGTNSGTVVQGAGTVSFETIENLTAGAGDDTFNVLGTLSGVASGGAGEDTFVLGPNAVATIAGNGGADTIRAPGGMATTFTVTAANAGTAAAGTGSVAFTTIENLVGGAQGDTFVLRGALTGSASGGAGNDTFAIEDGGSAGIIDGGAGLDTQTYAGMAGPVTVAIGGFTSIERLIGTGDGGDTLLGTNDANAFATTGIDAGTVDGIAYESFENLRGLGGDDTFTLEHAVSGAVQGGDGNDAFFLADAVGGNVDGGAGNDTFTFAAGASATIAGGAGNDTLAANGSAGASFDITAVDAGTAALGNGTVTFAGVENVAGGDGDDTFALDAALTGTVTGGAGNDRFEAAPGVAAVVDGGPGSDTLAADAALPAAFAVTAANAGTLVSGGGNVAFSSVESLIGGDAADTFVLDAPLAGAAIGGAGDDAFVIGAEAAGVVVGGAGNDSVQGSDAPTSFTLIGTATGSATAGSRTVELAEIETVAGGAANDVFKVAASFAGSISGGGGDDRFELDASTGGNLAGDAGDDVFVIAAGVTASGVLDGGAGYDTLDVAGGGTRSVVLTAAGAVDGFDGNEAAVADFRNIDALVGGPGSVVTGTDAAATWRLADGAPDRYTSGLATLDLLGFGLFDGGAGADRFVLETGVRAGDLRLRGGAGNDTLEVAGTFVLGGDLTVEAVESVAASSGELAAQTLRVVGASDGIGTAGAPLAVAIDRLVVENGAGGLYLVDRIGGLEVAHVQLTGGDIDIRVEQGDLGVGFVGTGGGTDLALPPTNAEAGAVRLTATAGSIERIADATPVDVRGRSATLTAFANIGSLTAPLTIVVAPDSTIRLAGANATINNPSLAAVDDSLIAGLFSDFTANATAAAVSVGTAAALQELAAIDWAGLDPNVALVDCAAPCLVLPEDQREDDAFAVLRKATKLLVIRHASGVIAVPVVALAELPARLTVGVR